MKKLGQEPAFPFTQIDVDENTYRGMSKRYWTAVQIMSGLIADPNVLMGSRIIPKNVKLVYDVTDEMLKQEYDGTDN